MAVVGDAAVAGPISPFPPGFLARKGSIVANAADLDGSPPAMADLSTTGSARALS